MTAALVLIAVAMFGLPALAVAIEKACRPGSLLDAALEALMPSTVSPDTIDQEHP